MLSERMEKGRIFEPEVLVDCPLGGAALTSQDNERIPLVLCMV